MDEKMSMTLRGWIETECKGGRALKTSKTFTKRWLKGNINVWKCFEEGRAMEWGGNRYGGIWSNGIKLAKGKGLLNISRIPSVFLWHHLPREVAGAPSFESWHLRLDQELGGQWNSYSTLIFEHFVLLHVCLFFSEGVTNSDISQPDGAVSVITDKPIKAQQRGAESSPDSDTHRYVMGFLSICRNMPL